MGVLINRLSIYLGINVFAFENLICKISTNFTCQLCLTRDKYHRSDLMTTKDDVIKWKHFPRYWPFVRGIHRSSVNSSHKGQSFDVLFALRLNKRLSKQLRLVIWDAITPVRTSPSWKDRSRLAGEFSTQSANNNTLRSHERHGVSNHWQLDLLLNSLLKPITKETLKLCIIDPLWAETTSNRCIPLRKVH